MTWDEHTAQDSVGHDILDIYNNEVASAHPDKRKKAFDHLIATLSLSDFKKSWLDKNPVVLYNVFPAPYYILHQAAKLGQMDIITAFVSRGYSFNTPNNPDLDLSRESNYNRQIKKQFNLNIVGTPLIIAFAYHNLNIAEYLIDKRARLDVTDPNGLTPLHYAALLGRADLIRKIHSKQGDLINKQDTNGRTPLHIAYYFLLRRTDVVNPILKSFRVFTSNLLECIQLLKKLGARTDIKDNDDITALNLEAEYDGLTFKESRRAAPRGDPPALNNFGGTWMGTTRNVNGRSRRNYNAKAKSVPSAPPSEGEFVAVKPNAYLRSLQSGATPTPSAPPVDNFEYMSLAGFQSPSEAPKGGRRRQRSTQKRRR